MKDYLEGLQFKVSSLTWRLDDPSNVPLIGELLNDTHLFIVDPLFIAFSKKLDMREVIVRIEGACFSAPQSDRGNFCLIVPDRLQQPLRSYLKEIASDELQYLRQEYLDKGRGEFEAETEERIRSYLRRASLDIRAPRDLNEPVVDEGKRDEFLQQNKVSEKKPLTQAVIGAGSAP